MVCKQEEGMSGSQNGPSQGSNYFGSLFLVSFGVSGKGLDPPGKSEILQFSYAVFDTESREVVSEMLHNIKPEMTDSPEVEDAISLSDGVQKFDSTMFSKCQECRKPVAIITFGKGNIKDYFRTDAKRKGITLFHHYNHFIDIVEVLREKHPNFVGDDLRTVHAAAKKLGLKISKADEDCGDECLLMATVLKHLLENGLRLTKENVCVIPDGYEPPEEAAPSEDIGNIVRMRGLPWDTKETELVEFFKPACAIQPQDVKIVLGFDGRHNGEAFVLMRNVEERDAAIRELHGRHIGRRWIEVFKASEDEYNRYMSNKRAITGGCTAIGESIIRMRGLPWSTNEYEVTKFFKEQGGYNISVDQVTIGYGGDGRSNGEAWVCLESPEKAEEARKNLNRRTMGRRYIELFPSTRSDMEQAKCHRTSQPASTGPMRYNASQAPAAQYGFCVVRMRGLPYHANEQHIVNFFQGYHMAAILPATAPIHGRPSGEAYVQFADPGEAWRAYNERQGCLMDRRYIELFAATQREMDYAAAGADPKMIRERAGRPY
eukprot:GHVS01080083.1.p1 GENE.GHVS01080083.1~~GHVS01080083.1.p1  ORF type:complete len:545 (+),score=74.13 GHVS01080083.1:26-1660(+)